MCFPPSYPFVSPFCLRIKVFVYNNVSPYLLLRKEVVVEIIDFSSNERRSKGCLWPQCEVRVLLGTKDIAFEISFGRRSSGSSIVCVRSFPWLSPFSRRLSFCFSVRTRGPRVLRFVWILRLWRRRALGVTRRVSLLRRTLGLARLSDKSSQRLRRSSRALVRGVVRTQP